MCCIWADIKLLCKVHKKNILNVDGKFSRFYIKQFERQSLFFCNVYDILISPREVKGQRSLTLQSTRVLFQECPLKYN